MLTRILTSLTLSALMMSAASVDASLYRIDSERSGASVTGFGHSTGAFKNITGWVAFPIHNPQAAEVRFSMPIDALDIEVDRAVHYSGTQLLGNAAGNAITFKSDTVVQGNDHMQVSGLMTVGSVSRKVTIPLKMLGWDKSGNGSRKAGFKGEFELNLSEYGIPTSLAGDLLKVRIILLGIESSETSIPTEEGPSS